MGFDEELWKVVPINTFKNYEVSNFGRVRNRTTNKVLSYCIKYNGYRYVKLSGEGRKKNVNIHRIVAISFLGNPPNDTDVVNHVDGDKENNHVGNLEWCTQKENIEHSIKQGRTPHSINGYSSKTRDPKYLEEVRERMAGGEILRDVAKDLKVDQGDLSKRLRAHYNVNSIKDLYASAKLY